jgi:hypothetical protein
LPNGATLVGASLALFVHQYPQLFVDFRGFPDPAGDLYQNSVIATQYNQATCALKPQPPTYAAGFWGLSASDGPNGYNAFSPTNQDGTVCLGCAGASVVYDDSILAQLQTWAGSQWSGQIWGQYGFVDGMNLAQPWFDTDSLGITVGALYLGLANSSADSSLWPVFDAIPAVQRGLTVARTACGTKNIAK